MSAEVQSIEQQVRSVTDDAVISGRHNLNQLVKKLDEELSKHPLHIHGAAVQMIQSLLQYRHQAMQLAGEEFKHAQMLKMQEAKKQQESAPTLAKPQ